MSVRYKCTVISLFNDEPTWGPIYAGSCDKEGTVEVDCEDIPDVNAKLAIGGEEIVGNFMCETHAVRVGDI